MKIMISGGPLLSEEESLAIKEALEKAFETVFKNRESEEKDLNWYIKNLRERTGDSDTYSHLEWLWITNPVAFIMLMAREIAVDLDKKYSDRHICDNDKLYTISRITGKIVKTEHPSLTMNDIRNNKHHIFIPLFRSMNDARVACRLLKYYLREVYGKQKNKKCNRN